MKETTGNWAIGRIQKAILEPPSLNRKLQRVIKKLNMKNVETLTL